MGNEVQAPPKKVSEIFLRYVKPLMDEAPKDVSPEFLEKTFTVPVTIWNASVMRSWGKSYGIDELVENLTKTMPPEMSAGMVLLVKFWAQRKTEMFPNENWGIEEVIVSRDEYGGLKSRVLARAPEKFKHQLPE